jgi:hypothetical protein
MNSDRIETIRVEKGAVLLDDEDRLAKTERSVKIGRGKFGEGLPSHR